MVLACGILFDLPVVVLGLVRAGVLGPAALRSGRKVVIVSILVLAAILTPSPDPIGQILLALPIILLYEVCVRTARWVEKK
jgi:sec-independent protein translocase protein TatC